MSQTFFPAAPSRREFIYDYGDQWRHIFTAESIFERESKVNCPVCIAGERACPLEHSGGAVVYVRWRSSCSLARMTVFAIIGLGMGHTLKFTTGIGIMSGMLNPLRSIC